MTHKLGTEHEHLSGLRVNDLVAKVARVTMKDTTRVMKSMLLVCMYLDIDMYELLEEEEFSVERPSADEATKCNEAFNELQEALRVWDAQADIDDIRALD